MLLRRGGHNFDTTAEMETVRDIKEKMCYVAFDPQQEEQIEAEGHTPSKPYTLPDGRFVSLHGRGRGEGERQGVMVCVVCLGNWGIGDCVCAIVRLCDCDSDCAKA